jgi:hypothetical protein
VEPPDITKESKMVGKDDMSTKYDELATLARTRDACRIDSIHILPLPAIHKYYDKNGLNG